MTIIALIVAVPVYLLGFSMYRSGLDSVRKETNDAITQQVRFYLATMESDVISIQEQLFDLAEYPHIASIALQANYTTAYQMPGFTI